MTEITYTVLLGIPTIILVLALIAYKLTTRRLDAMDREISQLRSKMRTSPKEERSDRPVTT